MPRPPVIHIEDREWLTTSEAAAIFEVSPHTIRAWIRKGALRSIRVNNLNRIPKEEIRNYIKQNYDLEGEW